MPDIEIRLLRVQDAFSPVSLTMKSLTCILLVACLASSCLGLGTIQKVSLRPSECNNCGMTALGQLNLKICGGSLPERCCSIVNIANYDNINEGIIYDYMGEHELEDCWNYSLQAVNSIEQFQLTVYHEGSDGGQLDYVEVTTTVNTVRCNLGELARRVHCLVTVHIFCRILAGRH